MLVVLLVAQLGGGPVAAAVVAAAWPLGLLPPAVPWRAHCDVVDTAIGVVLMSAVRPACLRLVYWGTLAAGLATARAGPLAVGLEPLMAGPLGAAPGLVLAPGGMLTPGLALDGPLVAGQGLARALTAGLALAQTAEFASAQTAELAFGAPLTAGPALGEKLTAGLGPPQDGLLAAGAALALTGSRAAGLAPDDPLAAGNWHVVDGGALPAQRPSAERPVQKFLQGSSGISHSYFQEGLEYLYYLQRGPY